MGKTLKTAYDKQVGLCRSGFAWIAQGFSVEECLLRNKLEKPCDEMIGECLAGEHDDDHHAAHTETLWGNATAGIAPSPVIDPSKLELSFLPPLDNSTVNITMYQALFRDNATFFDEVAVQSFKSLDKDQDGQMTIDDVKASFKNHVGGVRYAFMKIFGGLDFLISRGFAEFDIDGACRRVMMLITL
jgi:hypothetical protein